MQHQAVMALSGGLDSATVLAYLLHHGYSVHCVSFHYGSKHNQWEHKAADQVAESYGVPLQRIDLSAAFQGFDSNLLQGGGEIPEGHYTDESMSQTVVPARNIIFLSILAGLARSHGGGEIALGIHQGDHAIYADCRTEFYKAMDTAVYLGTDHRVEITAPFVSYNKAEIVGWGLRHRVPYHLTRTCYKDQPEPCGQCGACVERLEAFEANGSVDPAYF
jgi:7-cyano-7-deazaguanine synthase